MDNWRLVKIGTTQGQRKLFFKLKKEKQKLIDQGFDPKPKLLSERLGVSEREIVDMDQRLDGWDVSLDAPLKDDSDAGRIDFLSSEAESTEDQVAKKEIETLLHSKIDEFKKTMTERELEIFEKGMINNALTLVKKGLLDKPLHFDFVMGIPGAITGEVRDLLYLVESIPEGSTWTVAGIGRQELPLATAAIILGGHVRVGFEDNVLYKKGQLAKSNAELVERIVRIAKELGREVATPDEARKILGISKV